MQLKQKFIESIFLLVVIACIIFLNTSISKAETVEIRDGKGRIQYEIKDFKPISRVKQNADGKLSVKCESSYKLKTERLYWGGTDQWVNTKLISISYHGLWCKFWIKDIDTDQIYESIYTEDQNGRRHDTSGFIEYFKNTELTLGMDAGLKAELMAMLIKISILGGDSEDISKAIQADEVGKELIPTEAILFASKLHSIYSMSKNSGAVDWGWTALGYLVVKVLEDHGITLENTLIAINEFVNFDYPIKIFILKADLQSNIEEIKSFSLDILEESYSVVQTVANRLEMSEKAAAAKAELERNVVLISNQTLLFSNNFKTPEKIAEEAAATQAELERNAVLVSNLILLH